MSGYEDASAAGGYPPRGAPTLITAPTPAAGADWVLIPPVGVRWRVLGGQAQLKTSAAIANRQVLIQIKRGGVVAMTLAAPNTQAAGLTYTYQMLPGVVDATLIATYPIVALPVHLVLDELWVVGSSTAAIDVGDQWSGIVLMVEELRTTAAGRE